MFRAAHHAVRAADPLGLVARLRATGRFSRDTALGGLFHPGQVSLRECSLEDSLHIIVSGTRVSVHRDRYSPLRAGHEGRIARYSVAGTLRHLLGIILDGLSRLASGQIRHHRLELDCAVIDAGDPGVSH